MSESQTPFPHDPRTASKTARGGVVTFNDLVHEDSYSIATRATSVDPAVVVSATYSLDEDTSNLHEMSRLVNSEEDGDAVTAMLLLRESQNGTRTMERALDLSAAASHLRSVDSSGSTIATFSRGGLAWDDADASIYFGGDLFRLRFFTAQEDAGGKSTLRIQAKQADGQYVTKFSIAND